jgi:hypothetical protein
MTDELIELMNDRHMFFLLLAVIAGCTATCMTEDIAKSNAYRACIEKETHQECQGVAP